MRCLKKIPKFYFSNSAQLSQLRKLTDAPFDIYKVNSEVKTMNYSIFSQSYYIKLFMRIFYLNVLDTTNAYYMALSTRDMEWILAHCESNLVKRIKKFYRQIDEYDFTMTYPEKATDGNNDVEMLDDKIFYGVFIERWRNLKEKEYNVYGKSFWLRYQLLDETKTRIYHPEEGYTDSTILLEETDEKRKRFATSQYKMIFESTNQFRIKKRSTGEIIYGPKEGDTSYSRTLFQLENRRESLNLHNLVITDVDDVLKGNPFVKS